MNSNYPVGQKDIDNLPNEDDLHLQAGLTSGGINGDGEVDWIGDVYQWDTYQRLCELNEEQKWEDEPIEE